MATSTAWRRFIRAQSTYTPQLESHKAIGEALESFDNSLLAQETSIWYVYTDGTAPGQPREDELDYNSLSTRLADNSNELPLHQFYFINRFLTKSDQEPVPFDHHKLRISYEAFQLLMSRCYVSPTFMFALSRFYLPNGRDFRSFNDADGHQRWSQWYFIPVRVQVPCSDKQRSHAMSTTGSNQMNPFHYLHLPDMEVDIRGSQIAVYILHNTHTDATTAICFNFMDGRWAKIVQEPQNRISEVLKDSRTPSDPTFVHLVYLTTVARWWNNALHSVNEQLLAYERMLQEDNVIEDSSVNTFYNEGSKALHAMAAHIQRYRTELDSLEDTATELARWFDTLQRPANSSLTGIEQVRSQLKATNAFVKEQEKKTQNILALVSMRLALLEGSTHHIHSFSTGCKLPTIGEWRLFCELRSRRQPIPDRSRSARKSLLKR